MSSTLERPVDASRNRYPLAVDAFLYAGVIFLSGIGAQESAAYALSGGHPDSIVMPVWVEGLGMLAMLAGVVGGPLLAWRVYGRTLHGRTLIGAIAGLAVGGALAVVAFFAVISLWRFVPSIIPRDEMGPVDGAIVLTLAVVGFLTKPLIDAARDLRGPRRHVVRHRLRLAALTVALAAVVVSVAIGGEGAELGVFMVPIAAAAACAVTGMDLLDARRRRH